MTGPQLELSDSVREALKMAGPDNLIGAAGFCQIIFKLHPKYAGNRALSVRLEETAATRRPQEWIDEVQALFDPGLIQARSKSEAPPLLHGKLLAIGLSLLEPALYQQLEQVGAFTALVTELEEPLAEILTERGRGLAEKTLNPPQPFDSVGNWSDDELQNPEEDWLGRAAFARFLAKRLSAVFSATQSKKGEKQVVKEGAYVMHLYGSWGSGKSTVLNFLKNELKQPENGDRWLVVEFNAWRNQHIDPPWWSLLESVFRGTKKKLSWWDQLREYYWRFNTGRLVYIFSGIVLVWLVVLAAPWVLANLISPLAVQNKSLADILGVLGGVAKDVGDIAALVATVWGGILAFNRSLLFGQAKAAQEYKDRIRDPMNEIKKRFGTLIRHLWPHQVVILIDDLDRCRSSYVVQLLEGIQTLFRDAPVVFIVAADRRWLNACYEQEYEKFKAQVAEPGKPMGTLFLEKAFRFSTPMPGISAELKKRYWHYLLQIKTTEQKEDQTRVQTQAKELISQAHSDGEIQRTVDASRERPFAEQRAIREAAVERLATPEIAERLEHTLTPYASLLEQNPREMKRLVNTYSANRALAILAEVNIERHQLVLWTILSLRWPQLADFLEEQPEMVDKIRRQDPAGTPEEWQKLFQEPAVRDVINDLKEATEKSASIPLDKGTVALCAQMRA